MWSQNSTFGMMSGRKFLSQCDHLFVDVGSNLGVQIRKLYEPQLYPGADVLPIFDRVFGPAPRCQVCAIAIEPNPAHAERQRAMKRHYLAAGVAGVEFLPFAAALLDANSVNFSVSASDPISSSSSLEHVVGRAVSVRTVDLARLLMQARRHLRPGARIVMKLDVEGTEGALVPHLLRAGALCPIVAVAFIEWHDSNLHLALSDAQRRAIRAARESMRRACPTTLVDLDDESYRTDGRAWQQKVCLRPSPVDGAGGVSTSSGQVAPAACCGAQPEMGCTRDEVVTPRGPTKLGVATSLWPDDLVRLERTHRSLAVWMRHYPHQVAPEQAFAFQFFRASGEQMAAAACSPRANECMLRTAAGLGRYSTVVDALWRSSNLSPRNLRKVLVRSDKRNQPLGEDDRMRHAPLMLAWLLRRHTHALLVDADELLLWAQGSLEDYVRTRLDPHSRFVGARGYDVVHRSWESPVDWHSLDWHSRPLLANRSWWIPHCGENKVLLTTEVLQHGGGFHELLAPRRVAPCECSSQQRHTCIDEELLLVHVKLADRSTCERAQASSNWSMDSRTLDPRRCSSLDRGRLIRQVHEGVLGRLSHRNLFASESGRVREGDWAGGHNPEACVDSDRDAGRPGSFQSIPRWVQQSI